MLWKLLIPLVAGAWCLVSVGESWAKPQHKESLGRYYGSRLDAGLKQCVTCHIVPEGVSDAKLAESGAEHNSFGKRLNELGEQLAQGNRMPDLATRLKIVADEDADGDGVPNEIEILAGVAPGDAAQKPTPEQIAQATVRQTEFRLQYRWEPWQPVSRPEVPRVANAEWVRSPIDAFIAAEHARHGLSPRPDATRHVLLRRVYLDLIGLPPSAEELREFLHDDSPGAYERVVDRLLETPQYGERWGRHWMDVWRYSDWAGWGAQVRDSQPHVWRWRDWIIDSLNVDKPYDRMIAEMLAADEVCPEDTGALRATGFLVRNYKRLSREQWMQDTVNHTAKAFLGLTFDCARCHDHMYDPISQEDYYRFRAIFEPYNVRTDRIPGEANVEKDGLPRVFDAEPAVVTYFFNRGDERQPDKDRPLKPGVPGAIGGSAFALQEVSLPLFAHTPDKRPFVVEDDLQAAARAIESARKKVNDARDKAAKFEPLVAVDVVDAEATRIAVEAVDRAVKVADLDLAIAEAKRTALSAAFHVERLESEGVRQGDPPAWESAARETVIAQRQEAVLEARKARFNADEVAEKAQSAQRTAESKLAGKADGAKLKAEVEKAVKASQDAQKKQAAAIEAQQKAEQETAAVPSTEYKKRAVTTYPQASTGRRSALARWLGDAQNPLTARVAANQIWMRHFGQPLVPTVFDFGNNGQPATHPALLDWLAAEFMQPSTSASIPPWSMKHLHRLIVTSQTYRMASTFDEASAAIDPDNRWLWRMPPRRMEAEVVRDCVLHVAGKLDFTLGGPDIDYNEGLKVQRRSLYFRHAPEKQMTFLRLFDAASPNECYRRKESIIPQQALALANSSLSLEQARRLARRLHAAQPEPEAFIRSAFEQVLSRPASPDEVAACTMFLAEQQSFLEENSSRLTATSSDPNDVAKPAANRTLRARENLTHVLLNHHDFVTIH